MAGRRRPPFMVDPWFPRRYVLDPRSPWSWVLLALVAAGVALWVRYEQREPAAEPPLTEAEFRTAVHEAAARLRADPTIPDPRGGATLTLDVDRAIAEALADDMPPVDVIAVAQGGADPEGDPEAGPEDDPAEPTGPVMYDYEIDSTDVSLVYCLRAPDLTLTDGPC